MRSGAASRSPRCTISYGWRPIRKTHSHKMMVGALEGQFLKMLAAMTGARRILEIGMYTGYSTLAWAEALPKDGTRCHL